VSVIDRFIIKVINATRVTGYLSRLFYMTMSSVIWMLFKKILINLIRQ